MPKRTFKIFSLLCLMLLAISARSQVFQFSQFYASPMILAPSFCGMTDNSRLVLNYRDQWPKIPGTFVTYGISYDQWLDKMHSGMGLLIIRDQAGTGNLSLTDVGLQYSWDGELGSNSSRNKWHFRPGVSFKYSQRAIDFKKLIFGDMLATYLTDGNIASTSAVETTPQTRVGYLDATASALVWSPMYWGGITLDHLFKPNQSFLGNEARVPVKVSAFGGAKIPLSKKNRKRMYDKEVENFTVTFHYRMQAGWDQLDLGAYYNKNPFSVGVWFRGLPVIRKEQGYSKVDAVIVMVGYKIYDLSIGYSYDLTVSKLIAQTGGSHEISLIYNFAVGEKKKKKHAVISCPKF